MIAFVTTIGESTTDLCIWSLKRNGFEVHSVSSDTTLWQKMKLIYEEAYNLDVDFVRVDADVVPNLNLTEDNLRATGNLWWVQFQTYDWFKQDTAQGGVQYITRQALPALVKRIDEAEHEERPETYMYRIPEFHNPRRCDWNPCIMGIQNYRNDMERVRETKQRRNQTGYDWELAEKLGRL